MGSGKGVSVVIRGRERIPIGLLLILSSWWTLRLAHVIKLCASEYITHTLTHTHTHPTHAHVIASNTREI